MTGDAGASALWFLPTGSVEQHGPWLPADTDTVIATYFADRFAEATAAAGQVLPAIPYGISPEHNFHQATVGLDSDAFARVIRAIARRIGAAHAGASLVVVNGHGGNRATLELACREFASSVDVQLVAVHPLALARWFAPEMVNGSDVHASEAEISLMLAIDPSRVVAPALTPVDELSDRSAAISALVLNSGLTFPWSAGDNRIADEGVIGPIGRPSADYGRVLIEAAVAGFRQVVEFL